MNHQRDHYGTGIKPRYSPVIQLGQLIQVAGFALSIMGATWSISGRLTTNEKDIEIAQKQIDEIKAQNGQTLSAINNLVSSVSKIEGALSVKKE